MDSNSQADDPPQRTTGWGVSLLGTTIAAFTLIMPLYVTAYYSNSDFSFEVPTSRRNLSQQP